MKVREFVKGWKFPFGYFLFWLLLCWIDRFIFILDNIDEITGNPWTEIILIYVYGLKMDLSMASYICALPAVIYFSYYIFTGRILSHLPLLGYSILMLLLYASVSIVNLGIYQEWALKISKRAIDAFFESPKEVLASANDTPWIISLCIVLFFIAFSFFAWKYLMRLRKNRQLPINFLGRVLQFLIVLILLFTAIRGGYGRATLNPSVAYHSTNSFHNHSSVNTHWAFMKEMITRNVSKNPYIIFDKKKAQNHIEPLFVDKGEYPELLSTKDVNVVLIILESFVADLIESLGGEVGVTPNMESIISQGVLFDQIYAASDRSDKGIISIFSGFPSQGNESIIKYIPKHEQLPSITQVFDSLSYSTSFYHGGQSEFYNFKSFMLSHGVDRVVDQRSFKPWEIKSSWGVYDDLVFERLLEDLSEEKEPFFASIFTITNHEPFDLETDYKFGKNSLENKFKSTAYYTDSVLIDFLDKAKKSDWFANTLFVMIADHGHRMPAGWKLNESKRYHIPMILYGDVLKPEYKGTRMSQIGNQSDLIATVLAQIGQSADLFPWSRNLLAEDYKQYAFYTTKGVVGVKTPQQELGYDYDGKIMTRRANTDRSMEQDQALLDTAMSYYQTVFDEFLSY